MPLVGTLVAGCRCSEEASRATSLAQSQPSAKALKAKVNAESGCVMRSGQFTLESGETKPLAKSEKEDDSDDLVLPFSVELGGAIPLSDGPFADGFAVAALRSSKTGNQAVVGLLPNGMTGGQVIDLGAVHGDAPAPRLASAGRDLLAVVPEADASGRSLRVALVQLAQGAGKVTFGESVHDGDDESQDFDLGTVGSQALLAWDDWNKAQNHGEVKIARFATTALTALGEPQVVSSAHSDAESPRVASDANGFWVGWAVNDPSPTKKAGRADGGADPIAQAGLRGVELLRLDAQAQPLGSPRRITPPGSKVQEFDLAVNAKGNAVVAWRSGDAALGDDDGPIGVIEVAASGTEERLEIGQIEGAGAPVLLIDPGAGTPSPGMPSARTPSAGSNRSSLGFLAISDPGEPAILLPLSASGQPAKQALRGQLGNATPAALRGDQLLLARSVGRDLLFSVTSCH